jgi:hypothetical protein
MWNEWLARTLRPRPARSAAPKPAHAPALVAVEETDIDELRPSTGALRAPAQDHEESSLAAEAQS